MAERITVYIVATPFGQAPRLVTVTGRQRSDGTFTVDEPLAELDHRRHMAMARFRDTPAGAWFAYRDRCAEDFMRHSAALDRLASDLGAAESALAALRNPEVADA